MVLELMDVKGLTISHIKSHLQMYRSVQHEEMIEEAEDAQGIKRNRISLDDVNQMNNLQGNFVPHYYNGNINGKSVLDSTVTTNYLDRIAPSPTVFPSPWKPMPEKMKGLGGRSKPACNKFKQFLKANTAAQDGDGNKMVRSDGSNLSNKSAASMIEEEDPHSTVSLELSLGSPISLDLTLG